MAEITKLIWPFEVLVSDVIVMLSIYKLQMEWLIDWRLEHLSVHIRSYFRISRERTTGTETELRVRHSLPSVVRVRPVPRGF